MAFSLCLLGKFRLFAPDGGQRRLNASRARWLLAYLALQPDGLATRSELISILWAHGDEERGRMSLRQSLLRLSDAFAPNDPPALIRDGDTLRLDFDQIRVDAVDLLRCRSLVGIDDLYAALDSWSGELLADTDPGDHNFWHWLRDKRKELDLQREQIIIDELERAAEAEAWSDVWKLALELKRSEPTHELAYQWLMRLEAANGNSASAIKLYAELKRNLARDSVEPSNATTELINAVRSGRLDFPTATNLSPSDTRLSRIPEPAVVIESSPFTKVAILPLRSLSSVTGEGSDSLQHLWDGTVEDIRTSLTYFRNLSVLSTSVTKSFQEKYDNPIRSFHRELGVEYALEGSVRTLGENAVLNVQLVNARTEIQAWGRRFRFTLDDLLSVHDDIIARIVVSIDQSITKSKIVESARKGTKSLSAFDCWARANQLFSHWTSDSDEKSVAWLQKAVDIDKNYARAYSNWAGVCNSRRILKPARPEVMRRYLDEALPLASKAVNLDPLDARSRVALGWALIHGRRFDDAWSQFNKAVDLNPYDTDTLIASAVASAYLARPLGEERLSALQLADQAMSLCPVHQPDYYHVYRSIVLYLGNEFEEAAETVLPVAHTITDGFAWLAASLVELGQLTEARFAAGEFLDQIRKMWADAEPPSDEDILMWVWDVTPLQDDEKRSHLRKALATAGLEGSRAAKAAG